MHCCLLLFSMGIIPAYAGNTVAVGPWPELERDHPRICGEHELQTGGSVEVTGSSPHMRGTLRVEGQGSMLPGIIPAYAGNTESGKGQKPVGQGSSPHMRGTHALRHGASIRDGIIPAYAGNTGEKTHT